VVARPVALAFVPLDGGARHEFVERAGPEDEVDAHALVAGEPQLLVVPVGVTLDAAGAEDVDEAGRLERREGIPLGLAHVGSALEGRDVPDVDVERGDVEVAHERELQVGVRRQPAARLCGELRQPLQLVRIVRIVELSAVRYVQAPQPHVVDRHAEGARLLRQVAGVIHLAEAGGCREAAFDIRHRVSTRERHAVPLVEPVHLDLVAGVGEGLVRKLLRLALDLLHGQNVDVLPAEPVDDSADPSADGVHIPGRYTHGTTLVGPGDSTVAGRLWTELCTPRIGQWPGVGARNMVCL
jgi:hypothetical protein